MRSRSTRIALLAVLVFFSGAVAARAAIDAGTLAEPMESGKTISGSGFAGPDEGSGSADLFTGRFSYRVPIEVPPGTAGIEPRLTLAYSSGSPNGWVGFGWQLGLGSIRRSTKKGVPAYDATSDEFLYGNERLIHDDATGLYHTERESFQRIERNGDTWIVTRPDGTKLFFGSDEDSRVANPGFGLGDPIYAWHFDRALDTHGNSLRVAYDASDPGVLYPKEITYTYHDAGMGEAVVGDIPRRVRFCLEGDDGCDPEAAGDVGRPDPIITYRAGFEMKATHRLKVILVEHGSTLVRKYVLGFDESGAASVRSLLTSVTRKGNDRGSLPPLTFSYQPTASGFSNHRTWANPSGEGDHGNFELIRPGRGGKTSSAVLDMNGDGVADRVTNRDQEDYFRIYFRKIDFQSSPGFGGASPEYTTWDDPAYAAEGRKGIRDTAGSPGLIISDLIDLNGDGLPDRVARNSSDKTKWHVWLNLGDRFDPTALPWSNPSYSHLGKDRHALITTIKKVSDTSDNRELVATVIDLNGDGLPDRLAKKDVGTYPWYVYWNNGEDGFGEAQSWSYPPGQNQFMKFDSNGSTRVDLFDINGDGLVDLVKDAAAGPEGGRWLVYFGDGRTGFAASYYEWSNPSGIRSVRRVELSSGDIWADVVDVNGDGLPDRVRCLTDKCTGNDPFQVYLNTGSGFAQTPVAWVNPSTEYGFREVRDIQNGSTTADFGDLNGDGMPDRCTCGTNGSCDGNGWRVYPGPGPKPDLLVGIDNGLGGLVTVEYAPSTYYKYFDSTAGAYRFSNPLLPFVLQTAHRIRRDDGRGTVSETSYYYEGGLYYPPTREFRGFAYVEVESDELPGADDTTVRPIALTRFYQDNQLKGRAAERAVYDLPEETPQVPVEQDLTRNVSDSAAPLARVEYTYAAPADGDLWSETDPPTRFTGVFGEEYRPAAPGVQITHLVSSRRITFDSDPTTSKARLRKIRYDSDGNVLEDHRLGDEVLTGTAEDGHVVRIQYIKNPALGILRTPEEVSIEAVDGTLLRRAWLFYDESETLGTPPDFGDVTRRTAWLDTAGGDPGNPESGPYPTTRMAYDQYGNVVTVTDPNLNLTTITYGAFATFPAEIENALLYKTTFTYDSGLGALLTQTDPNGAVVGFDYDEFGREVESYARPSAASAKVVLSRMAYDLTGKTDLTDPDPANWQRVTTTAFATEDQSESIRSVVFLDGFLRAYLAETDHEEGRAVRAEARFDLLGQVESESLPYFADNPELRFARYRYDALGRLTEGENPDGTRSLFFYEDWSETAIFLSANATIERKSAYLSDAFGRAISSGEFEDPASADRSAGLIYGYDLLGNLTNVYDQVAVADFLAGNPPGPKRHVTTIEYDSLSRKTSIDDPDMGFWSYEYDAAGNLERQTDAKGQVITVAYDSLHRPFLKDYPPGEADIVYQYDTAPVGCSSSGETYLVGRLTRVTDQAGCETHSYDFLGRATKTTRVTGSYAFKNEYIYDLFGRVTRRSFPDAEVYDFFYSGPFLQEIRAVGRGQSYVRNIDYDAAGQKTAVSLGFDDPENSIAELFYDYEPDTLLLSHIRAHSGTGAGGQPLLDRDYFYFPTGDIERIDDRLDSAKNRSFLYDGLARLKEATGPFGPGGTQTILAYEYDSTGNLKKMDWDESLGRGRELFYDDPQFPQPHAVDRVREAGADTLLSYDDNGNLLSKGALSLTWNADGLPTAIQTLTGSASYLYDHAGSRARKTAPEEGSVRDRYYVGADFEWEETPKESTKHFFAGGTRVATVRYGPWAPPPASASLNWIVSLLGPLEDLFVPVISLLLALLVLFLFSHLARWRIAYGPGWAQEALKRTAVGLLAGIFLLESSVVAQAQCIGGGTYEILFYAADHLGSTQLVLDKTGSVVEETEYLPFGEILSRSGSLNHRYKFNGKERDPETGFAYYGARYYDPSIGRFISPDPFVSDPFDGQAFNRYSYVQNNPLRYIDPTGFTHEDPPSDIPPGDGGGGGDDCFLCFSGSFSWGGGGGEAKKPPPKPKPQLGLTICRQSEPGCGVPDPTYPAPVQDHDYVKDVALAVGETLVELFVPGVGETQDVRMVVDSDEMWYWRVAAGTSLAISLVTVGSSPNVAAWLRAFRRTRTLARNARRGRAFEKGALNALKVSKNKKAVKGFTRSGKAGRSIPDALSGGITEVKDVVNLSFTRQLQIQADAALGAGVPFNLIVSPRTQRISKPLQRAVMETGGTIQVFDPAAKTFTSFRGF